MCGIAGLFNGEVEQIYRMVSDLDHRGPDVSGVAILEKGRLPLGHVRSSIIDIDSRSNQPFGSSCGKYSLVFDGEIYNYEELRQQLAEVGYQFRTNSDTEVFLNWLIHKGVKGIDDLAGMFAFCFFDSSLSELIIARDHIGEKPLYYMSHADRLAFCSEIQPMLELPWCS